MPAAVAFLVILCLAPAVFAQDLQHRIQLPGGGEGYVDWINGQLEATGYAVPPANAQTEAQGRILARRGAILDAQRNLVEVIGGVQLSGETSMVQAMANDVVRSSVSGAVEGAVIIEEGWRDELMAYSVTLEIPLERVRSAVRPTTVTIVTGEEAPTGLVVDARGLDIVPSILIDVYDESGDLVVGGLTAVYRPTLPSSAPGDASDADVDDAAGEVGMGEDPFVVRATALRDNRIDLVIAESDGRQLLQRIGGDPMATPFSVDNSFVVAN